MHKAISLAVTLAVAALLIIGCSGGGANPTVPLDDGASITPEPEGGSQRFLLGVFEIDIDAAASRLTIEPVRNASAHYDVTDYITPPQCEDCLEIEVLEFKPIDHYVKLKVAIRNPTHFTVYDVRGIMISNFEGMHLLNADSYTDLWDDGGYVTINPFRAFATDWPHREILPDTGHARIYEIEYPTLGDLINALLVFDASWPGNCEEPYTINEPIFPYHDVLYYENGSKLYFTVEVLDWQQDVNEVTLSVPLITGEDSTPFYLIDDETWGVEITNNTGAPPGEYKAIIKAKSTNSGTMAIYDVIMMAVRRGWARTWGGSSDQRGREVAIDGSGNAYITGRFEGTVDFDPGPGVDEHISHGDFDIFLSKFDPNGNCQWARTWGGSSDDRGYTVGIDGSGNAYITGSFADTVDFDPGPGVDEHTANVATDIFLSKFDSAGVFQWVRTWGGNSYIIGLGVAINGNGNAYITGHFQGTVDFDPGPGVDKHTSNGYNDMFLSKFDSAGDLQWARTWGGSDSDTGYGVAIDLSGNAYITGVFKDTVDFDPGPGADEHTSNGKTDIFLSKFDSAGDFQWARTWGGNSWDAGYGVAIDGSGNAYITGHFQGTADFDPGPGVDEHTSNGGYDMFLSKFDSAGDFQWARTWGGSDWHHAYAVAIDGSGNAYITGEFSGTVDFDPGPGVDEHTSNGGYDIFLSKFPPDGNW